MSGLGNPLSRQREGEGGASPGFALARDVPTVPLHDGLGDGQTQPHPGNGGLARRFDVVIANANWAPPGHYLLFIVNSDGVPSVAPWIRIG